MPNFLEKIFARLQRDANRVVLREIRGESFATVTGGELLEWVRRIRGNLQGHRLQAGDRVALLAPNSIGWLAVDLALMAEGAIVVPLYYRQGPTELVTVMKDCSPRLLIAGDPALAETTNQAWSATDSSVDITRPITLFIQELLSEVEGFASSSGPRQIPTLPNSRKETDLVTIVYTSGTSGEPKGVGLHTGNVSFMLERTTERLDQLMTGSTPPDTVFHYLPLNFAASWIAMLSFLLRDTVITLSTDLNKLADEIRLTEPHYFLNVPTLLERVRRSVDDAMSNRPAMIRSLYARARAAWLRTRKGEPAQFFDGLWLALGRRLIFRKITKRFGPNLWALICGSAPLASETQEFFLMLGIPVLQVYGLTETTGICTMDDPRVPAEPGHVGQSVDGIEMRIGDQQEILVRGPHIFPGYWNRAEDTARVLQDSWFHTGDQGERNERGNWRIIGRIKNLIILNSGHNIAPEPIEDRVMQMLPGAQNVVIVGNGRGYLCALVAGTAERSAAQAVLDAVNRDLPHYRQIRNFAVITEPFTAENGLLTSNGKLRRAVINQRFAQEIASLYDAARPDAASVRDHEAARGKSA